MIFRSIVRKYLSQEFQCLFEGISFNKGADIVGLALALLVGDEYHRFLLFGNDNIKIVFIVPPNDIELRLVIFNEAGF